MNLLKPNTHNSAIVLFLILFSSIILFYISVIMGDELLFPIISISLLTVYLISKKPKFWLFSVFLTSPLYLVSNNTKIDISDILSGILWIGGLYLWLFFNAFIHKKKLVDDIADWFFIFFYICLLFNFFISYLNGNDLEIWIRTALRFTLPLMYFPIKEHFRSKQEFKELLIVLLISFFGLSIYMLTVSAILVQDVQNAWELGGLLRLNQGLLGVTILVLMTSILYVKGISKLPLITALIPIIIVFMVSLSRIFWAGMLLGIIYAIFFLPKNQKNTIIIAFLAIFTLAMFSIVVFLGDRAELILSLYLQRFTSMSNFMKDQSLLVRLDEYGYAITDILRYPWAGNGFAHEISYYNRLVSRNWVTTNVHNGYILMTLRFGIPLSFMYYSVIFYKYVKTINYLNIAKYSLEKMVLIGLSGGYLLMFISNFLTGSFMTRDGDILLALMFALTTITTRLIKEDVSE